MRSEGVRGDKRGSRIQRTPRESIKKATDKLRRDINVLPPGQSTRPGRSVAVMTVQLQEVSARALGQLSDFLAPPPRLPVAAALENQGSRQEQ